jgi:hypothetical protein
MAPRRHYRQIIVLRSGRPLDQQPAPPFGRPIAPTTFTVTDVPADDGF